LNLLINNTEKFQAGWGRTEDRTADSNLYLIIKVNEAVNGYGLDHTAIKRIRYV